VVGEIKETSSSNIETIIYKITTFPPAAAGGGGVSFSILPANSYRKHNNLAE